MERLAREKIATQQRLAELKHELSQWMDVLEIDRDKLFIYFKI